MSTSQVMNARRRRRPPCFQHFRSAPDMQIRLPHGKLIAFVRSLPTLVHWNRLCRGKYLFVSSDKRLLGDYEVGVTLTSEDIQQMIDQAKEFLGAAKHYLAKNSTEGPTNPNP